MLQLLRRLVSWLRSDRLDTELLEEMQLHLDLRRRALIEEGMAPEDAGRQARSQFGNVTVLRERARDQWANPFLVSFIQDLRFGIRSMMRTPGLTAVVVLTIGLGAGVNAALFFAINNMLLRTPDLPDPDTLVWVDDGKPLVGQTYPDYVDYRDRTTAFTDLAAYALTEVAARLPADDQTSAIRAVMASGNYFAVLQSGAATGRTFGPAEDLPPLGTSSVVLSDAYWARRFNRDPGVLGRTIELNFKPFTVVGVMPARFRGAPSPNGNPYIPEVWVPLWTKPLLEPGDPSLVRRTNWWQMQAIGRLREGVSVHAARAQVAAVGATLDHEYPGQRRPRLPWIMRVADLDTRLLRGETGAVIAVLSTASLFVLLIACANVAALLLARASGRRREIAVRLSLGASRMRIVRQFLAEGLLLSATGIAVGCIAAAWILQGILASEATQPLAWSFSLDTRTLTFAAFLVTVATISTGLMPARQTSKTALLPALTRSEGVRVGRLRTVLVGTEVAASVVLLLATALLLRGIMRAHSITPGMPVDRLVAVEVDARLHGYEGKRLEGVIRDIRRRIEAIPGVTSTAMVSPEPFSGSRHGTTVRLAEAEDSPGVRLSFVDVSSSFFETTGMQLVRGRWLDDRTSDEVVINETLASRLWPSADPLGARVTSGDFGRVSHVVVGVARNIQFRSLRAETEPFMFRPGNGGAILIRTSGPATTIMQPVRNAVTQVDRQLVASVRVLADGIAQELQAGRMMILSATGLGGLALLIALGGVGATAAQSVSQRTHEIGVRMALGARRRDAVAFIVRRALVPVVLGTAVGLAIGSQASRVLVEQLYGVNRLDPLAFTGSLVLTIVAAAIAAWFPARRAATVDPLIALRSE